MVRRANDTVAAVAIVLGVGMADVALAKPFHAPADTLGHVAAALGAQGGITITITDPAIAQRRSPGVQGDYSVRAALARALRGTGCEAVFYDKVTVRIVQKRAPDTLVVTQSGRPLPSTPPVEAAGDIVVTASKQNMRLQTYPGTVMVAEFDPTRLSRNAARGTAVISDALPIIGSTNLGPGRDKLYIRGIADSSFNGPTQSTVGQYFGEARLNYNGPDPDLNLYDIKRVEVLVGPQGTLYGAGSLGGIIRLVPNAPDSTSTYGTVSGGVSATQFGGIGGDAAAMLNLPMLGGKVALRIVAYGGHAAGYIYDASRHLQNVNSTDSFGQRVAMRIPDLAGWTVDVGGVYQSIVNHDAQYTLRGSPPLTRNTAFSQPFHSDYGLGYVTVKRMLGSSELVSTTSVLINHLITVFDAGTATGSTTPIRFVEQNDIALVSHETRVAGGGAAAPWVFGVAGLSSFSQIERTLGRPNAPEQIAGVRNIQLDLSAFGQASRHVSRSLVATAGLRLTYGGSVGRVTERNGSATTVTFPNKLHLSPSFAIDWRITPALSAYVHAQYGFRAPGLAVAPAGSADKNQRFAGDNLGEFEAGIRWRHPQHRLSARAAVFFVNWTNVQADLVDISGLPYTANVGDGRIYGLDQELAWHPFAAFTVTTSAFLNESHLFHIPLAFAEKGAQTLPNIAHYGVRAAAEWRQRISYKVLLTSDMSLRYVGESNLGIGPLLGDLQGQYLVGAAGARLDFGKYAVSLDVENVADVRANTFAFGNPFGLSQHNQITPLRPRTVRLGIDAKF